MEQVIRPTGEHWRHRQVHVEHCAADAGPQLDARDGGQLAAANPAEKTPSSSVSKVDRRSRKGHERRWKGNAPGVAYGPAFELVLLTLSVGVVPSSSGIRGCTFQGDPTPLGLGEFQVVGPEIRRFKYIQAKKARRGSLR